MLIGLVEADGHDSVQATLRRADLAGAGWNAAAFADVDYLFLGRAPHWPDMYLAGAILQSGASATGSGATLEKALWAVAGEAAEAERRAVAGLTRAPLIAGFGAHPDPAVAARHAANELVERWTVLRWWDGRQKAELVPVTVLSSLVPPPARSRDLHLFAVGTGPGGIVMVAASFDRSGLGFCFGAACRTTPSLAAEAAVGELVQAEFGLALAEMKRDALGETGLPVSDRLTLRHAAGVTRDSVLALTAGSAAQGQTPDGITTRHLGQSNGGLHVCAATLTGPVQDPAPPIAPPFGDLPLYRVAP